MRILVLLLSALVLTGCGFHPRANPQLPDSLGAVKVQAGEPYNALALELQATLDRTGIGHEPKPGQPASVLHILSETSHTSPLTVDENARVREYIVRYQVQFSLTDAAGTVLVAPQAIELSREYTYDQTASAGSPAEQELVMIELRRDMQAAILRRLDVVLRPKD